MIQYPSSLLPHSQPLLTTQPWDPTQPCLSSPDKVSAEAIQLDFHTQDTFILTDSQNLINPHLRFSES